MLIAELLYAATAGSLTLISSSNLTLSIVEAHGAPSLPKIHRADEWAMKLFVGEETTHRGPGRPAKLRGLPQHTNTLCRLAGKALCVLSSWLSRRTASPGTSADTLQRLRRRLLISLWFTTWLPYTPSPPLETTNHFDKASPGNEHLVDLCEASPSGMSPESHIGFARE